MTNPITIKVDDIEYIRKDDAQKPLGKEVIVRTYSAGVHIGTIKERQGNEVVLLNARRLWQWKGAFTLNAVATNGVDRKNSRISVSTPEILLINVCEIINIVDGVDLTTTEK